MSVPSSTSVSLTVKLIDTTGPSALVPVVSATAVGEWHGADPGSSPSNGCDPASFKAQVLDQVVWLPYYEELSGNGNNGQYLVAGFGAFYVTGYNFGGQYKEPQGDVPCNGSTRCLEGYFVEGTAYNGEFGGNDRGLVLVKLIG